MTDAHKILRVFPRKTAMTPQDDLAFVGDPPLWRPEADEVHVSVIFTWDIEEGQRLRDAWANHYPVVRLGGPALGDPGNGFEAGLYIKPGVVFTSRGCPNRCPWCLVWRREGDLRLLPVTSGYIVQDNNLLATPREHQKQVYAMLRTQRRKVSFPGGLDARLVDDWVADQLRSLKIKELFLAADTKMALVSLRLAIEKLNFLNRRQLRCYVLIGFGGETEAQAQERLKAVWRAGCLPFAQLYQPPDRYIEYSREWRNLARRWSRPAIMFSMMAATDD